MNSVPEHIQKLFDEIKESEDVWKSYYMAVWGTYYKIRDEYKDSWETSTKFGLPASKKKYHIYTPKKLSEILTSRDGEIGLNHLQRMLSLIEKITKELHEILYPRKYYSKIKEYKYNASNRDTLIKFLKGYRPFVKVTKKLLLDDEEADFRLACKTRDCFIHNGGQVDGGWIKAYAIARKVSPKLNVGEPLPDPFHQLEDWHNLFLRIAERIEKFLKNKFN